MRGLPMFCVSPATVKGGTLRSKDALLNALDDVDPNETPQKPPTSARISAGQQKGTAHNCGER
eukprot:6214744-Pleurochrysis_carterae.AAC.3